MCARLSAARTEPNNQTRSSILQYPSLALPSYVLPLNFDFASVLGLAIRYASTIFQVDFQPANHRTEGVAENDDVDVVR